MFLSKLNTKYYDEFNSNCLHAIHYLHYLWNEEINMGLRGLVNLYNSSTFCAKWSQRSIFDFYSGGCTL